MRRLLACAVFFLSSSAFAAPAVRLAVSNNRCLVEPCIPTPVPPTVTAAGAPFGLYAAAIDAGNSRDTEYIGTIFFTSTDPLATLPPSYTFVPANEGGVSLSAILRTPGMQTITVHDSAGNLLPGTLVMTVTGPGAVAAVPTLSRSGVMALALGLAFSAWLVLRLRS